MENSVVIPIPIAELKRAKELPSRSYYLDLEKGRIYAAGSIDGLAAVNQYIKKALLTPRFKCLIYDNQYGSEIKQNIIADDASPAYIETDMPRLVTDALLVDSRILRVYDFEFEFDYQGDREKVHIKFKADTIFGGTFIDEVI